jgi:hypothetical protein
VDPITLLATASAIWSGLKKASEFAQEAEGVWSQLSKYCGVADQLEQVIQKEKNKPKKVKLFKSLDSTNDTQEAFNVFEAEHKLMQMEKDIRHEFLYGAFANLEGGYGSMDGYRKFLEMRRKIRADRIKAIQDQQAAEKAFWDNLILWVGGVTVIGIGGMVIYASVMAILNRGAP